MRKTIANWSVELSGTLITIKKNKELIKALDVNPNMAVEKFHLWVKKVEDLQKKLA